MIRIFERTAITQHTFPSIGTDSTGGGVLTIADPSSGEKNSFSGILKEVKIACASTDFDVVIKASPSGNNSVDQVYSKSSGNLLVHDILLANSWINGKENKASELYLELVNNDSENETGEISIQLMNDIQKRWSSGK